jgi:hypothetical protein
MTESAQAVLQGGSVRAQLEKVKAQANPTTTDAMETFDKKLAALLGAPGGFLAPPSQEVTLSRLNGQAGTLYTQVWQADAEPTLSQMAARETIEGDSVGVLKRWSDFKNTDLPALNRVLREANIPEVQVESELHQEESQIDEE